MDYFQLRVDEKWDKVSEIDMVALAPDLPSTETTNYDDGHNYPHRHFTLLPDHLDSMTLTPIIGRMLELTNAVHIALNNNQSIYDWSAL